ncbi:MAG: hypothetical protein ACLP4V_05655 [Methylocella sp.]
MAVKQQLWTISGLSVELQRNQKLIARALAKVPADGKVRGNDAWLMTTALKALGIGSDAKSIPGQLMRLAQEIDGGLMLMEAESDRKKRFELAEEVGPSIGALDDLLFRACSEIGGSLTELDRSIMAPLVGRFAELLGAKLAA